MLDNPNLRVLADEETPTSTSGNLGTTGYALQEDDGEEEDYNDISSIICLKYIALSFFDVLVLLNTPKNSTQVEDTSPVDSHHNLELSRIAPPTPYAVHEQADPACVDQVHHMDVPTTLEPEDMVLTGVAGPSNTSQSLEQLRCHCGKECTR